MDGNLLVVILLFLIAECAYWSQKNNNIWLGILWGTANTITIFGLMVLIFWLASIWGYWVFIAVFLLTILAIYLMLKFCF